MKAEDLITNAAYAFVDAKKANDKAVLCGQGPERITKTAMAKASAYQRLVDLLTDAKVTNDANPIPT